uniref:Uncharacterized protein n=1 Tax=Pygocentrus nattereri TaxID=42514 RepID=A0AAR2KS99_PYGNA
MSLTCSGFRGAPRPAGRYSHASVSWVFPGVYIHTYIYVCVCVCITKVVFILYYIYCLFIYSIYLHLQFKSNNKCVM